MDLVEYKLLIVSVFSEQVTLSNATVLDSAGKELLSDRRERLCQRRPDAVRKDAVVDHSPWVAISVDVDLILPPGAAPGRVTHRIAHALKAAGHRLFSVRPVARCQP
jgi:hypothetical protein